jgi:23S rRNA (pseudouridine1915-N3)-methyltransferase
MSLRILSVGKASSPDYQKMMAEFEKRLDKRFQIDWQFITPSGQQKDTARRVESDALRAKLGSADFIVLLDERGNSSLSSEAFASKLDQWTSQNRPLTFIIGGAYGVGDELRDRADFVWSLSGLVFPHELVRLIITEQLYRAQCILAGHPYHHV